MRRIESREPRWWRGVGILGLVVGAAFWLVVIVVAVHLIGKYW